MQLPQLVQRFWSTTSTSRPFAMPSSTSTPCSSFARVSANERPGVLLPDRLIDDGPGDDSPASEPLGELGRPPGALG